MIINGARIYVDGVRLGPECELKIRRVVDAIRSLASNSEVSLRVLKSGAMYEVLLWGKAERLPIGVYCRGASLSKLLDVFMKRVRRQCLKLSKLTGRPSPWAMAG